LVPTKDGKFSLNTGSSFDPTAKMSDKWFLMVDKTILESIKANSYIKWETNAKITWLEYSDLECPFCAKLHNSGTPGDLETKYGKDLNKIFNHFPLGFHKNALPAAQILECIWESKGSNWFYGLMEKAFADSKSDKDYLIAEAVKLWADKASLEVCLSSKKFDTKINDQQSVWTKTFGVTWTPWNVLINNETGEYKVISWAYPSSEFISIIDKLLK
jgi:protein-disulfide isomerase